MNESVLEIAPPRRAFIFVFLITGIVLLLNGLAVLFFFSIPRSPNAIQPGTLSPAFGVGGAMPIVSGLLCLAGAGWMLNRHRKIAAIAELVHADLPGPGTTREGRDRLFSALTERADQLRAALALFPEAGISIDLRIEGTHQLTLELTSSGAMSGRLSPVSPQLARDVESHIECVVLDEEILLDLGGTFEGSEFLELLTVEILHLPPDFELSGDVHVSKRERRPQN